VHFSGIQLEKEPLFWPFLEIQVSDEAKGTFSKGCETCYTTISLISFAEGILTDEEIRYAKF